MIKSILITLSLLVLVAGCSKEVPVLSGLTMGTTYSVIVPDLKKSDQQALQTKVESALAAVNAAMSTYQPDSSISVFNASDSTEWFDVPEHFAVVSNAAVQVAMASNGAFDPTVGPLISLWGFAKDKQNNVPEAFEIEQILNTTGYTKFEVDTETLSLKKLNNRVEIDLNAIAKGYAVDLLALQVASLGYENYLIEIGGELRASGHNATGNPWRIGIEQPEADNPASGLHLSSGGVATSGDYRNAFESNGVRYSHIIDPRSGYPVSHALASVTVVAESAMLADAWATALMVLGPEEGMKIAVQQGLAGFFIVRQEGQQAAGAEAFTTRISPEFEKLLLR